MGEAPAKIRRSVSLPACALRLGPAQGIPLLCCASISTGVVPKSLDRVHSFVSDESSTRIHCDFSEDRSSLLYRHVKVDAKDWKWGASPPCEKFGRFAALL